MLHPRREKCRNLTAPTAEQAKQDGTVVEKDFHHYDWLRKEIGEASIEYSGRSSDDEDEDGGFGDFRSDVWNYAPLHATLEDETVAPTDLDHSSAMTFLPTTAMAPLAPHTAEFSNSNINGGVLTLARSGNESSALYASSFAKPQDTPVEKALSTTTSSSALLEEDVLVRVGPSHHEFRHSKAMLCYASDVLARHLMPCPADLITSDNNKVWWVLDIPNRSHTEWTKLQAFLQPRSVQAASISPLNLPTLLPWFQELQLSILLAECDILLSSLEWPAGCHGPCPNVVEDEIPPWDHDKRRLSHEPRQQDVVSSSKTSQSACSITLTHSFLPLTCYAARCLDPYKDHEPSFLTADKDKMHDASGILSGMETTTFCGHALYFDPR